MNNKSTARKLAGGILLRSDFTLLRLLDPVAHAKKYRYDVVGDCATCYSTILETERTYTRDGVTSHYDCVMRNKATVKEICEHMPNDPDVTKCHFCGFTSPEHFV